ncbi:MAG TPA: hypothetical protein VEA69_11690 [Tepidisphaeraceae bacterium]|nr:hypothetical protein [Tepidisphaeraceae bacterium]
MPRPRKDSGVDVIDPAADIQALDAASLPPDIAAAMVLSDPTVAPQDSLLDEAAKLRAKVAELEAEIQRRDAAAAKLPDSGPGKYRIVLRHSPAAIKKLVVEANGEADAWAKFVTANRLKLNNPQDPTRAALRAFEVSLQEGRLRGLSREITKLEDAQ